MSDPVRVLLVAEDPLARAGLAALLAPEEGCTVVGQTDPADDLAGAVETYRPAAILWDLGWSAAPDWQQVAEVADHDLPLVLLVQETTPAAWSSGALGLLLRSAPGAWISLALQAAAQGLACMDPSLAPAGRGAADDQDGDRAVLVEELTPREMEVLQLLAEGAANKEIARRLEISEHTVKYHVNAILGKLGAQSRTEAVVRATRAGLILL